MKIALRTSHFALFFLPATLASQEPADTLPRYYLEEVTVTATRQPLDRAAVAQQVEVVSRTEMERTPAVELADLLKGVAGLDVIQYSALLSGVSVRGFRPQFGGINPRTLLLVDGRPAGATNLSSLGLAGIERVEILKGPASALHGSSAMGGVINVVTSRSEGPVRSRARGSYGSFATWDGTFASGGSLTSRVDFDLAVSAWERNAGYRLGGNRWVGSEEVVKLLAAGGEQRLPDVHRDTVLAFSEQGYRNGSVRVGFVPATGWRVDARAGAFAAERVQNPGDLNVTFFSTRTVNDLERYSGDVALAGAAGRHAPLLRAYATRENTTYYEGTEPAAFVNLRTPVRWRGAQLQDVVDLGAHSVTAGVDLSEVESKSDRFIGPGESAPPFAPSSAIRSAAVFAEARLTWLDERLVGTLGGRFDRVRFDVAASTLFDGAAVSTGAETHHVFNPSAGLLYHARSGLRLHGSAGRAFVTPDAFNVAGYSERRIGPRSVAVARGNPALEPERSVTFDAGVGLLRRRGGLDLDVTYFHTDVRQRVSVRTQAPAGPQLTTAGDTIRGVTTYVNADEAEIRGLEARAGVDLGALRGRDYSLRLFASGTRFLRAVEVSAGEEARIPNVADLNLGFGLEYDDLRRFHARLAGRYVGDRIDADFSDFLNPGNVIYPAFLVADLSAGARIAERYVVRLGVANLTDENYYEVRGYTLPGRSLKLELGVDF